MSRLAQARVATTFAFSFALAKGTVFLAAMAIPRLVDGPAYGAIELAMSVGLVTSSVLGLGIPLAATRLHLIDKDPRDVPLLASYALWMAVVAVIVAILLLELGYSGAEACCAAILGSYGLQFALSAYSRMRGYIHWSGWFDNVTILLICTLLVALTGSNGDKLDTLVLLLIGLSVLVGAGAIAVLARSCRQGFFDLLRQALSIGMPMVLFSLSSLLVFGTVRIAIERASTLSDVATFSLCARVALILLFLKQVLETGLFRRLYQMENAAVSGIFPIWIALLSAAATFLTVIGHYTADLLVLGTDIPAAKLKALFPSVMVQTMLWTLNSSLEMFTLRDLHSQTAALAYVGMTAVGVIVGLVAYSWGVLDLAAIVNVYNLAMLGALLVQMRLLTRGGSSFGWKYLVLLLVCGPWLALLLP